MELLLGRSGRQQLTIPAEAVESDPKRSSGRMDLCLNLDTLGRVPGQNKQCSAAN
jgi:hypothetical protein